MSFVNEMGSNYYDEKYMGKPTYTLIKVTSTAIDSFLESKFNFYCSPELWHARGYKGRCTGHCCHGLWGIPHVQWSLYRFLLPSILVSNSLVNFYFLLKMIAKYIKNNFDRKFGKTWHAVVGNAYGFEITYESDSLLYLFESGELAILLWKHS